MSKNLVSALIWIMTNVYGFGIPIDSLIESELDTAIAKPKSYFAYGRIGIIIVIPDARKVIYAYNG
ncbi:hypothetical protein KFZ76_06630 [Methylovulum psychrotolerans]|uniref:hypothetical protein n=1 Tax=Methylovulum psychrotolerans TaxID=1704499 RepID=UPI001BFFC7B8|nr:hypothetical protein [Methylovulum psychrotolerans]MBT9097385.1 hypothetical protein [Methylovulum psychrotolerans]